MCKGASLKYDYVGANTYMVFEIYVSQIVCQIKNNDLIFKYDIIKN